MNFGAPKLQLMQNIWSNRVKSQRKILACSDELDRQPKNSCPFAESNSTLASGGGGGRGTYMACKGTPRMPGLP